MTLRGATEEELIKAIRDGRWEPARLGKFRSRYSFAFNRVSLVNQKYYNFKTIEPIFADEENEIVVVTVKVYYSNEEVRL
jgi:hypothetical protein